MLRVQVNGETGSARRTAALLHQSEWGKDFRAVLGLWEVGPRNPDLGQKRTFQLDWFLKAGESVLGCPTVRAARGSGNPCEVSGRPGLLPRPEHMKVAVEEFIRWVTPILNMKRTVEEAHELQGQTLNPGDELMLMYSSANRDPSRNSLP
jgi:cytochrome P450